MKKITLIIFFAFIYCFGYAQPGTPDINWNGAMSPYNSGVGANGGGVLDIAVQTDNKILIVGGFTSYNSVARNRIARLNSDGTLDNTFNPGLGANDVIFAIALQSDGKIIIVGWFTASMITPTFEVLVLPI